MLKNKPVPTGMRRWGGTTVDFTAEELQRIEKLAVLIRLDLLTREDAQWLWNNVALRPTFGNDVWDYVARRMNG